MCLIAVARNVRKDFPLIIVANRDECYDRPSSQAQFWEEHPDIAGGRDLVRGGSWFAVTKQGRFAAVTNYRNPRDARENRVSRGELVMRFLRGRESAAEYASRLISDPSPTRGYNLLLFDGSELFWMSSESSVARKLVSGVFGLSNALLETPWPKVKRLKARLRESARQKELNRDQLFDALRDTTIPEDSQLPDTGVGLEWERTLSPAFIQSPNYGTRCSTILTFDGSNHWTLRERTYVPANLPEVELSSH